MQGEEEEQGEGEICKERFGISNNFGFVIYFELVGIFCLLGSSNEEEVRSVRGDAVKFSQTLSELFGHILS